MSLARYDTSNALEGKNSDDDIDNLNTLIRQAIGREPVLSFPRSTESPVQWLQLLHGLDPDSAGWPLLPVKVPMQKCEKCNREYYSPINYRRHMRVHHRLKKLDKDDLKNRDLLRLFWDKLSADQATEIVALKNSTLEGLPGATLLKELASLIRKPGIPSLPHFCIKAGSALLDIVQARPSRFLLSSHELFGVLDDASERTFLCGSAISMKKYIFDGEAAKIGLDSKNLVAFISFLLERRLVEAWIADKDAEALRCQKLLVEEEEAAKRRQSEILERKKKKKLRQKEQKAKEQKNEEGGISNGSNAEDAEPLSDTSIHLDQAVDQASPEILRIQNVEDADSEAPTGTGCVRDDFNIDPSIEPRRINHAQSRPSGQKPSVSSNSSRGYSTWRHEYRNWHGVRDSSRVPHTVGKKIWSRKHKPEKDEESLKVRGSGHEVLIGSIAISLGTTTQGHEEIEVKGNNASLEIGNGEAAEVATADYHNSCINDDFLPKGNNQFGGLEAARAFLAQRWKEAFASEHVVLVLSPQTRPALEHHDHVQTPGSRGRSILGNAENRIGKGGLKKKFIVKRKDGT